MGIHELLHGKFIPELLAGRMKDQGESNDKE
jgi:hypothetical protein